MNQLDDEEENTGDDIFTAEQLETFKILDQELTNKELSVIERNEKLRICEGDIVTVKVNFAKGRCSF